MARTTENQSKIITAGLVVIGDEILSGRTNDENTNWIADKLTHQGIQLMEVRIVPDLEEKIVRAVNTLKTMYDYVLTTGGIGPTHDDITARSIANAVGRQLERNADAIEVLRDYYGDDAELTESRLKMAEMPEGASLIPNPVSGAPGFIIENIHVMAGVPRIMQAMLDYVLDGLEGGRVLLSNTLTYGVQESELAGMLEDLQKQYPAVKIGSYPGMRFGALGVSVVLRYDDPGVLGEATEALLKISADRGFEPVNMSLQSDLQA